MDRIPILAAGSQALSLTRGVVPADSSYVDPSNAPRLALKFVLGTVVAFLVVGASQSLLISGQLRDNAEGAAEAHAEFVTSSLLAEELAELDLTRPLPQREMDRLVTLVRDHVLGVQFPVRRVYLWDPSGTIRFSDETTFIGQRRAITPSLAAALHGRTTSTTLVPGDGGDSIEQGLGSKLYATFVPLPSVPESQPPAVVEFLSDYAGVQAEIDRLQKVFLGTLVAGLAVLFVLLLPIASKASRRLRAQNVRLSELLEKERATIAELREADRMKNEFVAVVSHELRTPLTSVIGYLSTLDNPEVQGSPDLQREFLSSALRQANHLRGLVENLLTLSAIGQERFALSLEPVEFPEVVEGALSALGSRAGRVRVELPEELPSLITDHRAAVQIMVNLIDNALKFSPPDAPCLIGAQGSHQDVRFWVSDRGIGIAEDERARIFDRFYQSDGSATRARGGLGLGLSVVCELIRRLGGDIEVTSKVGVGSTFTVSLPIRRPASLLESVPERTPEVARPG